MDSSKISEAIGQVASQGASQTFKTIKSQFEGTEKDLVNQITPSMQQQNQNPTQNPQNQFDMSQQYKEQAVKDEKDIENVRANLDKVKMEHHETAERLGQAPKSREQETPPLLADFPKEERKELSSLNFQNPFSGITPGKTNLPQKSLAVSQAETKIETGRGTKA